jgi:hypothetical protein
MCSHVVDQNGKRRKSIDGAWEKSNFSSFFSNSIKEKLKESKSLFSYLSRLKQSRAYILGARVSERQWAVVE